MKIATASSLSEQQQTRCRRITVVKQSMDLLELLRKRGMDGDEDFLREALRVLVDVIMDAEVSARSGAPVPCQSFSPVRLASISFAGSPPRPGPVAGQRWSGSWGRQTPG